MFVVSRSPLPVTSCSCIWYFFVLIIWERGTALALWRWVSSATNAYITAIDCPALLGLTVSACIVPGRVPTHCSSNIGNNAPPTPSLLLSEKDIEDTFESSTPERSVAMHILPGRLDEGALLCPTRRKSLYTFSRRPFTRLSQLPPNAQSVRL